MKYIRTKNGVYDTADMRWCVCSKQPNHYKDKKCMIYIYVPVKEANAIEELCDGVYIEDKHNPHNSFVMEIREYKNTSNADKKYMVKDWNFYAFIKTHKGLIYIAKMNRKGELELL